MASQSNIDPAQIPGLLSRSTVPVSNTGQAINEWFSPNAANWTSHYNPGQLYHEGSLSMNMFRPEVLRYLESMGMDTTKFADQQAYDPNGNPVTPKEWDLTKSIADNPDAFASMIRNQSSAKGSQYLDDFLKQNNLGVRYGNQGNTYVNQLYNTLDNSVLAADVNEDKQNFMQKNGWMIPLAALGGIAAMGPTALGEGAVGLGSSGASITGGGISGGAGFGGAGVDLGAAALGGEGGGSGLGSFGSFGPSPVSPITQGAIGSGTYVPSLAEIGVTLPGSISGAGGVGTIGDLGSSNLSPITSPDIGSLPQTALNPAPAFPTLTTPTLNTGLLDQIKNSTIGKGIGQVADMVGGSGNLAGLIGAGLGAASGGGDNVATSQSKTDPRIDPYIYGDDGYLKALQAKYNANPSGINATMQQGLDIGKANLTDPQYAQTYQNMRSFGNGLLSQPMAGNPFTNGQGGQVPQAGLLANFNDRAKNMMFKGGGLLAG